MSSLQSISDARGYNSMEFGVVIKTEIESIRIYVHESAPKFVHDFICARTYTGKEIIKYSDYPQESDGVSLDLFGYDIDSIKYKECIALLKESKMVEVEVILLFKLFQHIHN